MEVQKSPRIKDDIELLDASGDVLKVIHVDIDPEQLLSQYNQAVCRMVSAAQAVRPGNAMSEERYGESIIALLRLVFGDDASTLLAYYDGRYTALLDQILPYIYRRIGRQIDAIAQGRIDAMKEARRAEFG